MGKGWVIRLLAGKIQIQVNKCGHQVGFTRTHGKTKQIIGVGNFIECFIEELLIVYPVNISPDLLCQFSCNHLICIICQTGILIQSRSCWIFGKIFTYLIGNLKIIQVQRIKLAIGEKAVQWLISTGDFEKQVSLDCLNLSIPQIAFLCHVIYQIYNGTFRGGIPAIP